MILDERVAVQKNMGNSQFLCLSFHISSAVKCILQKGILGYSIRETILGEPEVEQDVGLGH
jgi:hypothetical protein